jgi:hypothetical protein
LGCDADWIREPAIKKAAWINIQPTSNPNKPIWFSPYLYRARKSPRKFFQQDQAAPFAADDLAFNGVNQALAPR